MNSIHVSQARAIMDSGEPFSVGVWTSRGEAQFHENVVSLRYDVRSGTRNLKFLSSGQIRRIRDVLIFEINSIEVYV